MMVRSFLPVGQGALYCECFYKARTDEKLNIVYDCGSLTNVKIVEREIKNNFEKGERIEALFISHLDEDHVNGIPFLLDYCKVKRIYFPLITEEHVRLMKVSYWVDNVSGFVQRFAEDPEQAIADLDIGYSPDLVRIEEAQQESLNEGQMQDDPDIPRRRSGENVFRDIRESANILAGRFSPGEWLYIPYNFRQEARIKELMDNLEAEFNRPVGKDEVETLWINNAADDRKKIKAAYKKVTDGLNTNSMTLFSGIDALGMRQYIYGCCGKKHCKKCCYEICDWECRQAGCLYTGDYNASQKETWDRLFNAYGKYWKYIGCVQIPHHGSRRSFNAEFLKMDVHYIISAGYNNRYRHPHASVMKAFGLNWKIPHIVTEQIGSAIYFMVK